MEANQPTKCNCLIRHVCTPKEHAQVTADLKYARSIGDTMGTYLALAALGKCPSQR